MKKINVFLGLGIFTICSIFILKTLPLDTKKGITVVDSSKENISSDYSILIQSPIYDAIVMLDKDSKEINLKVLDESSIDLYNNTNKYITLTEQDITFLKSNADELLKELENKSMLDKYSFVSKMLEQYDTNIKMSDLISIAMSYLK